MRLARSIMAALAVLAWIISAIYLFVPSTRAEQDELSIRKYQITADFPCRPKRGKKVIGGAETGGEMPQTILVCSQGGVTYSLSATEYSEQTLKTLTADAWAKATLDGLHSNRTTPLNQARSCRIRIFRQSACTFWIRESRPSI